MATFVFRSATGPLMQTQVGAADLVATFHAAHATYGWLGGLDSVRYMINIITNKFIPGSTKLLNLQLDNQLKLLPTTVHILTSVGPQELFVDDAAQSFGSDSRTQIIGLTLCALAHEMGGSVAVRMFTQHLVPRIFNAPIELLNALEMQLSDKITLQKILNEGASRGLPKLFIDAISSSNLPAGDREWIHENCASKGADFHLTEVHMVGGLVRWIGEQSSTPYLTRSGLVARVAIYLRTVGYMIGRVKSWDGSGSEPPSLGPNAVVLVLGGSYPTDNLMMSSADLERNLPSDLVHYYTLRTVGNLLLNAMGHVTNISPERLQEDFEDVQHYILSSMKIKWVNTAKGDIGASFRDLTITCEWQDTPKSSAFERSIASVGFPNSGDLIAPCYRRIASEALLKQVRDPAVRNESSDSGNVPLEISRYRAITACIVIAITSCLAADSFPTVLHQTVLQLMESSWIDAMCHTVDRLASGQISLNSAVIQLAALHAGRDPSSHEEETSINPTIGYRNGIFSILPTLLLKMEPTAASLGFSCGDRFFANLALLEDGRMNDAKTPFHIASIPEITSLSHEEQSSDSSLAHLRESWTGLPHRGPPDRPLYLSLEKQPFSTSTEVLLTGRIDGSVVGRASIRDVLWVIARSAQTARSCNHISHDTYVRNIKASYWAMQSKVYKPVGSREVPAYISVEDDSCWALLLAGESRLFNGVLVDRCITCAKELYRVNQPSVDNELGILIAYKS
jgi:hypothetical protein